MKYVTHFMKFPQAVFDFHVSKLISHFISTLLFHLVVQNFGLQIFSNRDTFFYLIIF